MKRQPSDLAVIKKCRKIYKELDKCVEYLAEFLEFLERAAWDLPPNWDFIIRKVFSLQWVDLEEIIARESDGIVDLLNELVDIEIGENKWLTYGKWLETAQIALKGAKDLVRHIELLQHAYALATLL